MLPPYGEGLAAATPDLSLTADWSTWRQPLAPGGTG